MWTLTVPKMLRPYFLHHRELLGKLCHAAWETAQELMAAAAGEVDGFRTGMVVVAQTAGDALKSHPHLHALVPRDGWACDGAWVPVPFVDLGAAERVTSVILDPAVITTILEHLRTRREAEPRAPPHPTGSLEAAS